MKNKIRPCTSCGKVNKPKEVYDGKFWEIGKVTGFHGQCPACKSHYFVFKVDNPKRRAS